jgi:hypothetical protein
MINSLLATFVKINDTLVNLDDCSKIIYKIINSRLDGRLEFYMIKRFGGYSGTGEIIATIVSPDDYHRFISQMADAVALIILGGGT